MEYTVVEVPVAAEGDARATTENDAKSKPVSVSYVSYHTYADSRAPADGTLITDERFVGEFAEPLSTYANLEP